jgi:hypothetical protein
MTTLDTTDRNLDTNIDTHLDRTVDRALDQALADLTAAIAGRVLRPGTPEYAALATLWNVAVASTLVAVVEVASAAPLRFWGGRPDARLRL